MASRAKKLVAEYLGELQSASEPSAGRWARKTEFLPREDGGYLRRITRADGTVESERVIAADSPAAARAATGLSQARFAKVLGVSSRTLQEWEQGRRHPSPAARALLLIAAKRPDVFREVLG